MVDELKEKRWRQRFQNLERAFGQLQRGLTINDPSDIEIQGIIQIFEFTFELSWNTMKDFLTYKGQEGDIFGSRDATRKAFSTGLINDGEGWMDMLQSRNKTSHIYNEETAEELANAVLARYYPLFKELQSKFTGLLHEPNNPA